MKNIADEIIEYVHYAVWSFSTFYFAHQNSINAYRLLNKEEKQN